MCSETLMRRMAGLFVLASVALGTWVSPWWFAFTAFVGFNLLQSSVTGFCPTERLLGRLRFFGCTGRNG